MKRRRGVKPIKDARNESELFRRRAVVAFLIALLSLCGLSVRFFYLQVLRYDDFSARSESNRVSLRRIAPSRGLIYDREGVLLAENVAAWRLEVVPEQAGNIDELLKRIRDVVPLSDDDIEHFLALRKAKRSFQASPLRLKLSEEEIARFAVERWRFPGVEVVPYLTRHYPLGHLFGHLVGYVGRIDENDLARVDGTDYDGTTHIGKSGIERSYEDLLHGSPGYELVEVNADGRPLRILERVAPKPGQNLYLTVDAKLQEATEQAFAGETGSAVAIDPRNGEVLAMVSVPGFDPNLFVNGISRVDYQGLLNAPHRPLFNRSLLGTYEPGSTIKPFLGLGGLELGLRTAESTVNSTGEFFLPGQKRSYRDWRRGGHGRVNLIQALAQSVNTYFYSLAVDMGIDRMSEYLSQFGFGAPTGIDLVGEGKGILPSREWKRANLNQVWFPGETVISGIGQGYWTVTPLQLANATATLADHGVGHVPHLLMAMQDGFNAPIVEPKRAAPLPNIVKNLSHWETVRDGMIAVTHGGTASKVSIGSPYVMAGKTGTAQRYSRTGNESNAPADAKNLHKALFIAFAPAQAPVIALGLVLEFGASGSGDAAPLARKIVDAWLLKDLPPPAPVADEVTP